MSQPINTMNLLYNKIELNKLFGIHTADAIIAGRVTLIQAYVEKIYKRLHVYTCNTLTHDTFIAKTVNDDELKEINEKFDVILVHSYFVSDSNDNKLHVGIFQLKQF